MRMLLGRISNCIARYLNIFLMHALWGGSVIPRTLATTAYEMTYTDLNRRIDINISL